MLPPCYLDVPDRSFFKNSSINDLLRVLGMGRPIHSRANAESPGAQAALKAHSVMGRTSRLNHQLSEFRANHGCT